VRRRSQKGGGKREMLMSHDGLTGVARREVQLRKWGAGSRRKEDRRKRKRYHKIIDARI
jgi:hypothetical protein